MSRWKRKSIVLTTNQIDSIANLAEKLYDEDYIKKPGQSEIIRAALNFFLLLPISEQMQESP